MLKKYPWLLPRNDWTGLPPKNYDYSWTELDALPTGWRIAFGDLIVADIDRVLRKANYVGKYRIMQIKEKFASLRWYDNGIPNSIYDEYNGIINAYESISEHVCLICGAVDVHVADFGWLAPLCKHCYETSINCNKPYEEVIDSEDDGRMPDSYTMRRYSNGRHTDTTYDISDITNRVRARYEKRVHKRSRA